MISNTDKIYDETWTKFMFNVVKIYDDPLEECNAASVSADAE